MSKIPAYKSLSPAARYCVQMCVAMAIGWLLGAVVYLFSLSGDLAFRTLFAVFVIVLFLAWRRMK